MLVRFIIYIILDIMRVGTGFDLHKFKEGRPLIIGGLEIPAKRGLDGVSDADVVLHAVCDAILGAVGKGDIGDMYPPEERESEGLDSKFILREVLKIMKSQKMTIENIDITIMLEEPKLSSFKEQIIESLKNLLNLKKSRIGFKIKSLEGMIPLENACAICSATVLLKSDIIT